MDKIGGKIDYDEKVFGESDTLNLAAVHNAPVPLAKSPQTLNSVLQGWQKSVPKLYQYPAKQLQVTVQRKSGEVDNITPKHSGNQSLSESARVRGRKKSRLPLVMNGQSVIGSKETPTEMKESLNCNDIDINRSARVSMDVAPTIKVSTDIFSPSSDSSNGDSTLIYEPEEMKEVSNVPPDSNCDLNLTYETDQVKEDKVPSQLGNCGYCQHVKIVLHRTELEVDRLTQLVEDKDDRIRLLDNFKWHQEKQIECLKRELEEKTAAHDKLLNEISNGISALDTTVKKSILTADPSSKYSEKSINTMLRTPGRSVPLRPLSSNTSANNATTTGKTAAPKPETPMQRMRRNMAFIRETVKALNLTHLYDPKEMRASYLALLEDSPPPPEKKEPNLSSKKSSCKRRLAM